MKLLFFTAILSCVMGAALWSTYQGATSRHHGLLRPPKDVLSDARDAIMSIENRGVFWFGGSQEDAIQIEQIVEVLNPNLRVSVLKVDGIEKVAIVNATHEAFGKGWMPLREAEQMLHELQSVKKTESGK